VNVPEISWTACRIERIDNHFTINLVPLSAVRTHRKSVTNDQRKTVKVKAHFNLSSSLQTLKASKMGFRCQIENGKILDKRPFYVAPSAKCLLFDQVYHIFQSDTQFERTWQANIKSPFTNELHNHSIFKVTRAWKEKWRTYVRTFSS
jgi:hypothetical protein